MDIIMWTCAFRVIKTSQKTTWGINEIFQCNSIINTNREALGVLVVFIRSDTFVLIKGLCTWRDCDCISFIATNRWNLVALLCEHVVWALAFNVIQPIHCDKKSQSQPRHVNSPLGSTVICIVFGWVLELYLYSCFTIKYSFINFQRNRLENIVRTGKVWVKLIHLFPLLLNS